MVLGGLQKLTLLDFPEHVACTVFTLGCNFRCPFCHNALLVIPGQTTPYDIQDFFSFLKKRKGILDGVAITGGEPLMQVGIEDFLDKVKSMGFAVKLDTNGAFANKLDRIIKDGLVDYVAMDIKNTKAKYDQTAGTRNILPEVEKSVQILMDGNTPYEFRTTAVKELHRPSDFADIGRWISGADRYYIQQFRDSGNLLKSGFTSPSKDDMQTYLKQAQQFVPTAMLRGLS